jgi:hypothetical protein
VLQRGSGRGRERESGRAGGEDWRVRVGGWGGGGGGDFAHALDPTAGGLVADFTSWAVTSAPDLEWAEDKAYNP